MRGAVGLADALVAALAGKANGANVTGVSGFNDALPLPLEWGEVLPLAPVEAALRAREPAAALPPLLVLGLPRSRYNPSAALAGGFRALVRPCNCNA